MIRFLIVGLGGALGAAARYAVSLIPSKAQFPVSTLAVNLLGAVLIGAVVGFASQYSVSNRWELFLKTGFCGGFTTFSTFSLEAFSLFEKGNHGMAAAYIVLSVALCLLGVFIGQMFGTQLGSAWNR